MDPNRPLLYIAAPYTRDDPVLNTHRVVRVASAVYRHTEWVPIVPHLTLLWHLIDPQPLEYWYEYDAHLLAACDAVVRLPGGSTGADREMIEAERLHIPRVPFADLPLAARAEWATPATPRATWVCSPP